MAPEPLVGLLLAAGRGTRFDPTGARSKLLELWDGEPLIRRAAGALAAGCERVLAVVGPAGTASHEALRDVLVRCGCEVVVAPDARLGLGHSLAEGARAAAALMARGVVVMPGDMPRVQPAIVCELARRLRNDTDIVAPVFKSLRGHPVVFGRAHLAALMALRGDRGARELLEQHEVDLVPVSDPGVLVDVDRPQDLGVGTR